MSPSTQNEIAQALAFAVVIGVPATGIWLSVKFGRVLWRWISQRLGRKKFRAEGNDKWSLGSPLLAWSRSDVFSIGNAVEGTLISGVTGGGKTSGSGAALARAFLEAGFGGCILTVKSDERPLWERYCRDTGRSDDLIIFGPQEPVRYRFNFLDHELQRKGSGAGLTENIVNLFSTVLEVAERGGGQGGGREDEGYWRRTNRQLSRNSVDLLVFAKGRISIHDLYRLVISAPTSMDQVRSEEWKSRSFCFHCMAEADKRPKSPRQRRDFEIVADYFLVEFPALSDKTRSVIVSTFTSMIDVLQRGILRELFCTDTNLTPEATEDGKIIVFDLPVKEFGEVGQFGQVILKYAFQRCIERRDVVANPRPVFLWADEAQYFVTSYDQQFQTTCRSARVATVLLTQNVSNFYAALGGSEKGKAEATSLFGNLNTKILHANGDAVTNEWAANLVGRSRQLMMNSSNSYQPQDWFMMAAALNQMPQTSAGMSETLEYEVQPSTFTALRTGGPANRWLVDAIVFRSGQAFKGSGRTWMPVTFEQRH